MIAFKLACVASAAMLLPPVSSAFLHLGSYRTKSYTRLFVTAIQQSKIDFLGSLDAPFDLNPSNVASTIFLNELVENVDPQSINRIMLESFDDLATGKWRIIYVEQFSSSLGKLLGDIDQADIEIGNDGSLISHFQYANDYSDKNLNLSFKGEIGTASNHLFIKVKDISTNQISNRNENEEDALTNLKEISASIAQSMIEKVGKKLFSGVVVVDVLFLDKDLMMFDFNLIGIASGKRIVARKEPDFF